MLVDAVERLESATVSSSNTWSEREYREERKHDLGHVKEIRMGAK
jgi:hypothetical protein